MCTPLQLVNPSRKPATDHDDSIKMCSDSTQHADRPAHLSKTPGGTTNWFKTARRDIIYLYTSQHTFEPHFVTSQRKNITPTTCRSADSLPHTKQRPCCHPYTNGRHCVHLITLAWHDCLRQLLHSVLLRPPLSEAVLGQHSPDVRWKKTHAYPSATLSLLA